SGNNLIDLKAKQILFNLGESHAFGSLSKLTSTTIALDLSEKMTRLSITGFAPSPDEAQTLAGSLNTLITLARMFRKNGSADISELLGQMKVKYSGNRLEADLSLSSEKASEMMKNKFGASAQQPNSN